MPSPERATHQQLGTLAHCLAPSGNAVNDFCTGNTSTTRERVSPLRPPMLTRLRVVLVLLVFGQRKSFTALPFRAWAFDFAYPTTKTHKTRLSSGRPQWRPEIFKHKTGRDRARPLKVVFSIVPFKRGIIKAPSARPDYSRVSGRLSLADASG